MTECGGGVALAYLNNTSCSWQEYFPLCLGHYSSGQSYLQIDFQVSVLFCGHICFYLEDVTRLSLGVFWHGRSGLAIRQFLLPSKIPNRRSVHPIAFPAEKDPLMMECPQPLLGWWWWSWKYDISLSLQSKQGKCRVTHPCMGNADCIPVLPVSAALFSWPFLHTQYNCIPVLSWLPCSLLTLSSHPVKVHPSAPCLSCPVLSWPFLHIQYYQVFHQFDGSTTFRQACLPVSTQCDKEREVLRPVILSEGDRRVEYSPL